MSSLWTTMSSMPSTFEDVVIVDLDPSKTEWSRIHEDLRVVYLRLNKHPPDLLWIKFFHEERESRTMMRRRGLWIEEGYISFDCLPDEIEPYHLPDIQRSVAFANRKYREQFERTQQEIRQASAADNSREVLEAMRGRLFTLQDQPTGAEPPRNAAVMPRAPEPSGHAFGEPEPLELPDDILALHDAALAAARDPNEDGGASGSVRRGASQYSGVHAPQTQARASADASANAGADAGTNASAPAQSDTNASPDSPAVTEDTLEKSLADFRARVRAAYDRNKR